MSYEVGQQIDHDEYGKGVITAVLDGGRFRAEFIDDPMEKIITSKLLKSNKTPKPNAHLSVKESHRRRDSEVSNNIYPYVADELVMRYPELADFFERLDRTAVPEDIDDWQKKASAFLDKNPPFAEAVLQVFRAGRQHGSIKRFMELWKLSPADVEIATALWEARKNRLTNPPDSGNIDAR